MNVCGEEVQPHQGYFCRLVGGVHALVLRSGKPLILVELDVANGDDFAILWNPYAIDVAAAIANQIADVYLGLSLIGSFVFAC